MLDFIDANYIWMIAVAIIFLLAIIGFIADKNGLINDVKKDKKETKPNKVEPQPVVEQPKPEPASVEPEVDDLPDPFEQKEESPEAVPDVMSGLFEEKPAEEQKEETLVPEENAVSDDSKNDLTEDVSAPVEDNPFEIFEQPVEESKDNNVSLEENNESTDSKEQDISLDFNDEQPEPESDLDNILNKNEEDTSLESNDDIDDDEIWKF